MEKTGKQVSEEIPNKQNLYTLRMSKNTLVRNHVDNFNRIILNFQGVGVKINDKDQAIILLCFFPNSYENFVDTTLMVKRQSLLVM